MENAIKMDDLRAPPVPETPIYRTRTVRNAAQQRIEPGTDPQELLGIAQRNLVVAGCRSRQRDGRFGNETKGILCAL